MAENLDNHRAVLPESGKRNILVTSALPYVNNVPHLGNIIGSVLSGDTFARYCRGRGLNTLYIGGTDEYGTTTEAKPLAEKCTPQELCDKYHAIHAEIYQWFNISFDIFGRTTTQLQTDITQDIFLKVKKNGFLQERLTTQLYCQEHGSFLADRFVEGECPICSYEDARGDQCDLCGQPMEPLNLKNPRCKIDGSTPITRDTKHIFLELDKLQPDIEAFFQESAKTDYDDKVIYSWFDACIGYVSITAKYTDQWEKWWRSEHVQLHQFIGKDNVVFHSVIFPGTQIGTGETWTKLHHLSTTDYLTYEGGKFSKSRGVGVFGDSAQKTGVASDDAFISANNSSLLNNFGNFVNRVLKFVNSRHYNNIVPDWTKYSDASLDTWKQDINSLLAQYIRELDAVKTRSALSTVLHVSQQGNAFLQSNKLDNSLALNEPDKCAAVIGLAINLIHLLAAIVAPYMPDTARSINAQLRMEPSPIPDRWSADSIQPGHEIGKAEYLFSRIKPEKAEEWRKAFGSDERRK
ncbi:unnamed protein product [Periconia digitata]|uniref:methionine--tRNA ligase n=1 Tax=Periconia digitata TaxID=1303443 RepID=A0A9W4XMZ1_9PLEO|nr:unnamed protein product [Periconia digitata]